MITIYINVYRKIIQGIKVRTSLTRSLPSSPFRIYGGNEETDSPNTDIATCRLNWPRGRFSENKAKETFPWIDLRKVPKFVPIKVGINFLTKYAYFKIITTKYVTCKDIQPG